MGGCASRPVIIFGRRLQTADSAQRPPRDNNPCGGEVAGGVKNGASVNPEHMCQLTVEGINEEYAAVPAGRQHHPRVSRVRCQLQNDPRVAPDGVEQAARTGVPDLRGGADVC